MFKKIIILSTILCSLASCNDKKRHEFALKYMNKEKASKAFKSELADASPEFKRGWADGCEVGMSTGSTNAFYKMFYRSNQVDGYTKTNSSEYSSAYSTAFIYCLRYEYVKQKGSLWGAYFTGYR